MYFKLHSKIDKSQTTVHLLQLYFFVVGTLKVHWKSLLLKWLRKELVRVGRLCGPHRPEPKPFGQANLVALGPEIAQTRLPWLSVTVLIC